jgi:hypothetical protein
LKSSLRAAAIVWSVVAVVAHSDTGVAFPLWMLLAGSLLVIVVGWLVAMAIAAVRTRPPDGRGELIRSWIRIPSPIVVAFILLWLAVPLRTRLFLSGPALQQSAGFLSELPPSRYRDRPPWVGLFRIREFRQFDDELRFLTSSCGLVDNCGLVFAPSGPPHNRGEDTFAHIYGDWWHWHQSW